MHRLEKMGKLHWILVGVWLIVFISFWALLFGLSKKPLDKSAKKLDPLRVYSEPDSYAEVDRQKAAEFSLEKVASVVNYLLLATAAVLGFTAKAIMDLGSELAKSAATGGAGQVPPPRPPPAIPLRRGRLLLSLLHAGIVCFLSLMCGLAAYLYLPSVGTYEAFSIGNELRTCVLSQIVLLFVALLFLLIALWAMVRDLLP
jgi:hypothetical protein